MIYILKMEIIRFKQVTGLFTAKIACACYGKKGNLDVKWKRQFLEHDETKNYVGVKYHVQS